MPALVKRAMRGVAMLTPVKPMVLRNRQSVVSFTFDDFAASAAHAGADVLGQHDVRGTYYVAGSLEGSTGYGEKFYSAAEIEIIKASGHEIGCHTFGHPATQDIDAESFEVDLKRNAANLAQRFGVEELHSFAYPFGIASLASKKVTARRFATARGTRRGLQTRWADLSQLRSNRIGPDIERGLGLIRQAAKGHTWLIFHTHDVSNSPSRFGCTPSQLDSLIIEARKAGLTVLPIKNALGYVSQPGH